MELLNHFNITSGQLIPNLWRIVISCMEIWLAVIEGDMIRVDKFVSVLSKGVKGVWVLRACALG